MNVDDFAVRGESLAQRVLGGVEGQVAYVQTISHDAFSILAPEVVRFRRASDEGDMVTKVDGRAAAGTDDHGERPRRADSQLSFVIRSSALGRGDQASCVAAH